MPEWLQGNEWAAWLAVALILGVVEAATVDLVFLMLAGGALAGTIAALAGLGLVGQ
ncbi:MAG: NfeD family protein, partial [Micrococcales bacterium]|nr:NfeD family protein [Micrococcales bacterium]